VVSLSPPEGEILHWTWGPTSRHVFFVSGYSEEVLKGIRGLRDTIAGINHSKVTWEYAEWNSEATDAEHAPRIAKISFHRSFRGLLVLVVN
jgi:hypothetical protein